MRLRCARIWISRASERSLHDHRGDERRKWSLEQQLHWLRNHVFGRRSEKGVPVEQGTLAFAQAGGAVDRGGPRPERRPRGGNRSPRPHRAIRAVGEAFTAKQRDALLVMATGSGKTRTVIALVDQLMRAGWVKRVLFLADRTALVNQATGAFKTHLPNATTVNLVTEKSADGRVYVSTYPTMMNLINDTDGGRAACSGRATSTWS